MKPVGPSILNSAFNQNTHLAKIRKMGIMNAWTARRFDRRFPNFLRFEKRPLFNLFWTGLFSMVNYFLSIIIKETMIAIKVPKATIRDNDS